MSVVALALFTSTVIEGLIIISATIVGALLGFFAVARFWPGLHHERNNPAVTFVFALVSVLYSVLLAFVVVTIWQEFTTAEVETRTEVTLISNLLRDSTATPSPDRQNIRRALLTYTRGIAAREWKSLARGNSDSQTAAEYEAIWQQFYNYSPKTNQQVAFYREALTRLNDLGGARRLRLLEARSTVPLLLWLLIILGGAVVLIFTYMFWIESIKTQAVSIAVVALLLGFVFFLIAALEHPFAGSVRVKPDAFEQLYGQWQHKAL